jgi:CheY-like chemotaxis protein
MATAFCRFESGSPTPPFSDHRLTLFIMKRPQDRDWSSQVPVKRLTIGVYHGDEFDGFREDQYVNRLISGVLPDRQGIVLFEPDLQEGSKILFMLRNSKLMMDSARKNSAALLQKIDAWNTPQRIQVNRLSIINELQSKPATCICAKRKTLGNLKKSKRWAQWPAALRTILTIYCPLYWVMMGDELAKEIMKIRPEIPIILCTGFSERISEKQALEKGFRAFVMKPFTLKEMAGKIRAVLDAGSV